MKSLSDIIQEKLKVNSKTQVYKDISDWCIAVPYNDLFDIFNKESSKAGDKDLKDNKVSDDDDDDENDDSRGDKSDDLL